MRLLVFDPDSIEAVKQISEVGSNVFDLNFYSEACGPLRLETRDKAGKVLDACLLVISGRTGKISLRRRREPQIDKKTPATLGPGSVEGGSQLSG